MAIYLAIVRDIAPTLTHGTQHAVTIVNAYSLKTPQLKDGEWNKRVRVSTDNSTSNPWLKAVRDAFNGLTEFPVTEDDISYMGEKDLKHSEMYYLVDAL